MKLEKFQEPCTLEVEMYSEKYLLAQIANTLFRIEELLTKDKPTKKRQSDPSNQLTWSAYHAAYISRYRVEPTRNAMVNGLISNFVKRVPKEECEQLINFFLKQNDAYYLQNYHSMKCLVADCEKLLTRMRSGIVITGSKAREVEKASQNINESRSFLENKYGGKNGSEENPPK